MMSHIVDLLMAAYYYYENTLLMTVLWLKDMAAKALMK